METNKDLIQSYIVTTAKYNFSAYEKRILYRIIEKIQFELEGKELNSEFRISRNLFEDVLMTIPASKFLKKGEQDKNHAQVKKALKSLRNKTIEIEDSTMWKVVGIIEKPKLEKGDSLAHFTIDKDIYEALLNFAKGYRKFELKTAFNFESPNTMRFYELFSNQKKKQRYSIEWLKTRFGVEEKYIGRPADFIKYVVKPAKKELDKKSPYSFEYEKIRTGRKTTHLDFKPKFLPQNMDEPLEKKRLQQRLSPQSNLPKHIVHKLGDYGFSSKEIKNNMSLLEKANEDMEDFASFLATRQRYCEMQSNTKATLINIIKLEIH